MPISADCPQCGKTYRVKDDFAGKKFRCKACQGVVSVPAGKAASSGDPWDELDLGSFQDHDTQAADEFEAPAAPRRRKSTKKKKSRSGGMPVSVMIAMGCEVLLILLYLFNVIRGMANGEFQDGAQLFGGICGAVFVACINGGAALGYLKRQNVIRWISFALTCITCLTCFGCGIFALVGPGALADQLPPDAQLDAGEMMFAGVLMIVASTVRLVLLICLLLPSSSSWFDA